MDPACGSGGFLLHALEDVRLEANEFYEKDSKEHFDHWHSFAKKHLFGIEINEEIALVAKMNMIIHDDGHTNIIGNDALEPLVSIARKNASFAAIMGVDIETGRRNNSKGFSKVVTNPPFGAVVKDDLHSYLPTYELSRYVSKRNRRNEGGPNDGYTSFLAGTKAIKQRSSVKTEVVYCERVWQLLKPGGQAAIVLPDGLLTNASLQGVRDWILERFKVLVIVSLPHFAFAHFGTGVKSSVVFLEKRQPNIPPANDEAIFMAIAENIGYDATGRRTYRVKPQRKSQRKHAQNGKAAIFLIGKLHSNGNQAKGESPATGLRDIAN